MKRKQVTFKYDKVLLIDDNHLDTFISSKMIEANFFAKKIFVSTNGLSALEFLKNLIISDDTGEITYPDVIFVDLNMPVMDGFQFIENFKNLSNKKLKKCKIAVLTSSSNEKDMEKVKKIDENVVFLRKPLTLDTLTIL